MPQKEKVPIKGSLIQIFALSPLKIFLQTNKSEILALLHAEDIQVFVNTNHVCNFMTIDYIFLCR